MLICDLEAGSSRWLTILFSAAQTRGFTAGTTLDPGLRTTANGTIRIPTTDTGTIFLVSHQVSFSLATNSKPSYLLAPSFPLFLAS